MPYSPFVRYPKNEIGRDFYVTDVHGCFRKLDALLKKIGLDETKDRLFIGGDLVDRGPESEMVLEWLGKPWVHSVRGNHEVMCLYAGAQGNNEYHMTYGGVWFSKLKRAERQKIINAIKELPIAIEVEGQDGRWFGIVHAECPFPDWGDFIYELSNTPAAWVMGTKMVENALWSFSKMRFLDETPITSIDRLFVGHCAVDKPKTLGNVLYLDTGACFEEEGGYMTVIDMNTEECYRSDA